jgi:hypothetical protein
LFVAVVISPSPIVLLWTYCIWFGATPFHLPAYPTSVDANSGGDSSSPGDLSKKIIKAKFRL